MAPKKKKINKPFILTDTGVVKNYGRQTLYRPDSKSGPRDDTADINFADQIFSPILQNTMQFGEDRDIYLPLIDPSFAAELLLMDTTHATCCNAKAADVTGLGFKLIPKQQSINTPTISPTDTEPEPELDEDAILEETIKIHNLFFNSGADDDMNSLLLMVGMDVCSIGWGCFEVVRDVKGIVNKLNYIPASTIRVKRDGSGYVQKLATNPNEKRHYVKFPNWTTEVNKKTGQRRVLLEESKAKWINQDTGEAEKNFDDIATELIFIKNPHPADLIYGIPDGITATRAMQTQDELNRYNYQFFLNNCIPRYAIILENFDIDIDSEDGQEYVELLRGYFREHILGNNHSTLVMPVPQGSSVKFEALDVEQKEGSFLKLSDVMQNRVLLAHRMTPAQLGIVDELNLGADTGYSQAENYKNRVLIPRQKQFAIIINNLLEHGLFVNHVSFQFIEVDIRDLVKLAETGIKLLKVGGLTINELRTQILNLSDIGKLGNTLMLWTPNEIFPLSRVLQTGQVTDALEDKMTSQAEEIRADLDLLRQIYGSD